MSSEIFNCYSACPIVAQAVPWLKGFYSSGCYYYEFGKVWSMPRDHDIERSMMAINEEGKQIEWKVW